MTGTFVDRYLGAFEVMEKLNEKRAELQKAGEALGGTPNNVLLIKIEGPVWYTIYHHRNLLLKG
jgi:hypothetical protein